MGWNSTLEGLFLLAIYDRCDKIESATMEYRISRHAEDELIIRDIPRAWLERAMQEPDQVVRSANGPTVFQSRTERFDDARKGLLLRAVVDERASPALVITVYLTSKVEKYWQP